MSRHRDTQSGNRRSPSRRSSRGQSAGGRRPSLRRPEPADAADDGQMRLQKFLASAGVDSRRNCEGYIRDARVTIDGQIVTDPATAVDPDAQDVRLDGERLRLPRLRYYVLNKPKGVLCTNRDPSGRPRAVDLVPSHDQRLFTVGRLDENTQGLLLVTNDGELAERLAHPRYQVVRRYRVQVAGIPEPETLAELKKGMHFSDGFFRFGSVRVVKKKGRSTFLELELREGKNREIRRLLARAGHKVISLERIAFGPLRMGHLSVGKCRELRSQELQQLQRFVADLESGRSERFSRPAVTGSPVPAKKRPARRPKKQSDQTESADHETQTSKSGGRSRTGTGRKSTDRTGTGRTTGDRAAGGRPKGRQTGQRGAGRRGADKGQGQGQGRTEKSRSDKGRSDTGRTSRGRGR